MLQRELVQKTLHQLSEYNSETHGGFVKPILARDDFVKNWNANTQGLSAEEIADLEWARDTITHYEKIYNIFEYSSDLSHAMNILETRICAHNPSVPVNVYRTSRSGEMSVLFPEIEACLQAYYDLIDDCKEYPDWQKKVRFDLGNTVSYLALTIEEADREAAVTSSEIWARFDMEKQLYFK